MTHNRPYREAMDEDTALQEIERNAGTQFDPAVVSIFLKLHKTTKNITS
jgi:HD-GYP domain-containing protein (c-di-GMP phosphodiesterase class II)